MFKKFILMFSFCISIFGITAFADVKEDVSNYAFGLDDNLYYLSYTQNGNKYLVTFNSDSDYYFFSSEFWQISGGIRYKYNSDLMKYEYNYSGGAIQFGDKSYEFSTNCSSLKQSLNDKGWITGDYVSPGGGAVNPPVIAPTVGQAIQKIVPDLSNQLQVLLPVGVILLSTMLGVSLVKLLVHLFL